MNHSKCTEMSANLYLSLGGVAPQKVGCRGPSLVINFRLTEGRQAPLPTSARGRRHDKGRPVTVRCDLHHDRGRNDRRPAHRDAPRLTQTRRGPIRGAHLSTELSRNIWGLASAKSAQAAQNVNFGE